MPVAAFHYDDSFPGLRIEKPVSFDDLTAALFAILLAPARAQLQPRCFNELTSSYTRAETSRLSYVKLRSFGEALMRMVRGPQSVKWQGSD
jgi:hypothetical protein